MECVEGRDFSAFIHFGCERRPPDHVFLLISFTYV